MGVCWTMVSVSHHLGCLSEAEVRAWDLSSSIQVWQFIVQVGGGGLVWTGLRRRGWNGVEVGVSMQLMRSGRGLGSFKATCELRKRW